MEQKKRPISPHLSIYKPQISSILSILHRLTGAFLFFALIALCWLMIALVMQSAGVVLVGSNTYHFIDTWLFKAFLLALSFCLYYHLLNGIRHLFWDAGYGYEIKSMNMSGILVVAVSLFMTGATLALAIINRF
jgi:succinate dehydrogenase / fumarate reductase cytochrome b subunit